MPSILILPIAAKGRDLESGIPADDGDGSMSHTGFVDSQSCLLAGALRVGPHGVAGDIDIRARPAKQRVAHKAAHRPCLESGIIQYRKKRQGIFGKIDPHVCAQVHHHLI